MDTAAQHSERDRPACSADPGQPPEPADPRARSRSVSDEPEAMSEPEPEPESGSEPEPGSVPEPGSAPEPEPDAHPRSRSALAEWLPGGRITLTTLLCLFFLLLLSNFVLKPFEIPSTSMEPGLRVGDRVLVNKLAYRLGAEPRRGDVVVFDGTGYFGAADYIKRVVGTEGDRVVCCDRQGRIEVNGGAVDEDYLPAGEAPSHVPFDVVVPPGRLFLLGDHRSGSRDSRDHLGSPGGGMIPVDAVVGRAEWIAWPFDRLTGIDRPGAFGRVPAPTGGAHG
ncbi:signal peptidase I [Streptomyces uncialis]|uniref:signal peptidase I n=1 Tax=Streptomyces uncialis TaxID=1048205 RepID=UPI00386E8274